MPPRFPVFSKPTTNLRRHGRRQPGHRLRGRLSGRPDRRAFLVHAADRARMSAATSPWWTGGHAGGATPPAPPAPAAPSTTGTSIPRRCPDVEDWCGAWSSKHLAGYTGMVNFETIGGRIIEATSAVRRPVARSLWPKLGRSRRAPVRHRAVGICRHKPLGWLQRRPVRAAWTAVSPSPCCRSEGSPRHGWRVQRPDHLP